MINKHDIKLPTGICAHLTETEFDKMTTIALGMEPLWENALGENWKSVITADKLKSIYKKI
jgi:3-deoxy-alpha-D-manno-octulosonate 8-oxidase